VFDENTRTVHLSRAGTPHPVLMRPGEEPVFIECEGLALGIDATAPLKSTPVELAPGHTLL
jgi:serine phosphatase RsbU (regulator of sigma subunit)